MLTAHHNAQFEVLGKLSAREQADLAQQVANDFADHASRVSIGHSRYRPGADGRQSNRGRFPQQQWDLTFAGVYRLTPDLGTMTLLVDDFALPNGLAFSPDEKLLYINDSRRRHIRALELLPNGTLAKQTNRVFADLSGDEPGVPDGMKVDVEGNVYCGGAGGIWIMDPSGKKLGRIVHGHPATTNIAFGGDDRKTLYFTSRTHLGSINVKIPGVPVPVPKKTTG